MSRDKKDVMNDGARRHNFVWNNYTQANVDHLKSLTGDDCDYIVFGYELAPTTGTPHLQGYVEWRTPKKGSTVKNKFDPRLGKRSPVSLLLCDADREYCINYCKKSESKDPNVAEPFYEFIHKEKQQGKRNDYTRVYDDIVDTPDFAKIAKIHPEMCIKHSAGIKAVIEAHAEAHALEELRAEYDGCRLMKWQHKLRKELLYPAHDRNIIWYVDDTGNGSRNRGGNKGKSWFAKYAAAHLGALAVGNAKCADLAHAYNKQKIVIFDLSRTQENYVNYTVMEEFKSGKIFSPKYNSSTKYFKSPHVIVFANWPPSFDTMSEDRYIIRRFSDIDTEYEDEVLHTPEPEEQEQVLPTPEPVAEPMIMEDNIPDVVDYGLLAGARHVDIIRRPCGECFECEIGDTDNCPYL